MSSPSTVRARSSVRRISRASSRFLGSRCAPERSISSSLNQDLYSMSEDEIERSGAQRLPRNLLEALEILRTDDLARTVLGDDIMKSYLTYKSDEWERYHQAITDWEVNEYLRLY